LLRVMWRFGQHALLGIICIWSDVGRLHQWVQNNIFPKIIVSVSVSPKLLKRISLHKQNHMASMLQSNKSHIHKLAPSPKPSGGRVYAGSAITRYLCDLECSSFVNVIYVHVCELNVHAKFCPPVTSSMATSGHDPQKIYSVTIWPVLCLVSKYLFVKFLFVSQDLHFKHKVSHVAPGELSTWSLDHFIVIWLPVTQQF
jgi:hypothetical protein